MGQGLKKLVQKFSRKDGMGRSRIAVEPQKLLEGSITVSTPFVTVTCLAEKAKFILMAAFPAFDFFRYSIHVGVSLTLTLSSSFAVCVSFSSNSLVYTNRNFRQYRKLVFIIIVDGWLLTARTACVCVCGCTYPLPAEDDVKLMTRHFHYRSSSNSGFTFVFRSCFMFAVITANIYLFRYARCCAVFSPFLPFICVYHHYHSDFNQNWI